MSNIGIDNEVLSGLKDKLEALSKSFNAIGYQGMQNAGQSGMGALSINAVDPVLYSITVTDKQLRLTKNLKTLKAVQPVYFYKVQTAVATSGLDLAGFENFLPQEDQAQYLSIGEPLKIYGIKKSLGDMVQLTVGAGGLIVDAEKENDKNAAMAMSQQLERDGYAGGDYFLAADGSIDTDAPLRFYGNGSLPVVRNARGIQNNLREGDKAMRGVPGDFEAYGNSFSIIFDQAGASLDQGSCDDVVTAVMSNLGKVDEVHATPAAISEFRKTFFPIQRADINQMFSIRGPDVKNDEAGFSIQTVSGNLDFLPCIYKHTMRQKAAPISGTYGSAPVAPTISSISQSSAISSMVAGDRYLYVVQAVSISGMSAGTTSSLVTVTASGNTVSLTIAAQAGVEHFQVFRTPVESSGKAGSEGFIGKVVAGRGATVITDANTIVPGYESVLFLPRSEDRVQMAVLGNLLNRSELGRRGLAVEHVYSSYLCFVIHKPRSFALVDNCKQRRRGALIS